MIIAAALLVLVGLGLFLVGVLTGVVALYWACVGACVVAAVLLYLARRRMEAAPTPVPARDATPPTTAAPQDTTAPATAATTGPATPSTPTPPSTPAAAPQAPATPAAPSAPAEASTGRHARVDQAAAAEAIAAPGAPRSPEQPPGTPPTHTGAAVPPSADEPPVEEVEVTDLLLVVDLTEDVLVVDEHPRYHVPGCRHLAGQQAIPIPMDEARTDGFTPCGTCRPDATLADQVRARRRSAD